MALASPTEHWGTTVTVQISSFSGTDPKAMDQLFLGLMLRVGESFHALSKFTKFNDASYLKVLECQDWLTVDRCAFGPTTF